VKPSFRGGGRFISSTKHASKMGGSFDRWSNIIGESPDMIKAELRPEIGGWTRIGHYVWAIAGV